MPEEKPLEATPHRIRKARREGDVARSSQLTANLSFALAVLAVAAVSPQVAGLAHRDVAAAAAHLSAPSSMWLVVVLTIACIGCAAAGSVFAAAAQSGGFALIAVTAKFERLDPAQGLRRLCSRETLDGGLRAVIAFGCATAAILPVAAMGAAAMMNAQSVAAVAAHAWKSSQAIAGVCVGVGLLFSAAEYAASRGAWLRKLRMSFDERRREVKEEEGDAATRGRRRALHRALLRGGLQRIKAAAFVVANPRHVAVALEYRPPDVPVPRVLIRALDAFALEVRAAAARHGIPVVESAALARALYRDVRAGQPIPVAHYVAVAEVVVALGRIGTRA
ncbi:MAG: EscU/YscU/HrcU family type III secretion system export apparatus switch protein [Candidatus Eremiobacteraeota bacterium]|nr:EscU/YscU/HrcU family type III secretion system export apparatus switch protein [Candidatus Eremiobacteraeota bacterium]MBV9055834.1 EscU/YscU/HrcU family type III secretion system export apparatus switch protein [Candidatus Eremiobacteraeota bacterium]MBV9700662.1 EscU/YscU/HrcU family type III secretion system export apparatus switch protein [Candidatus Eremiobacteraeota bacterium]